MKKNTFWLRTSAIFLGVPLLIMLFLIFLTIATILTVKLYTSNWTFWIMTILSLVAILYFLFIDKNTLTRLIISEHGIQCFRLKKEIKNIKWSEIENIKNKPNGWSEPYLSFVSLNTNIDIELNPKIYNAIMLICPNETIKTTINSFTCFKCYHRK